MSESIIRDNYFLLYSLILGVSVTILYDLLRICRRVIKHKDALVSIEDFFYWVIVAISVFYLMHKENNGTLRWYAVLGAGVGMSLYKKLVSTFFVNISSKVLSIILKYAGKATNFFGKPFKVAGAHVEKNVKKARNKGQRGLRFIKKKLTEWIKTLKMVLCKQ